MEGLICLLVGMTALLSVAALIAAARAQSRIGELEKRLARQVRTIVLAGPDSPPTELASPGPLTPAEPSASGAAAPGPPPAPPETVETSAPAGPPPAPASPRFEPGLRPATGMTSAELEERLGVRAPVWIGAIALFLAGAFLVKYTFDSGLLTPPVRVLLGIVFGSALVTAAHFLHRRWSRIASGLAAAGIADLYASLLAATNLYHLVGPTTGFSLLAAVTAGAIGLSLRHGILVASLGLLGGFVTPALIGVEEPQPGALFTYLFLLQAALWLAGRRRGWEPLTGLALLGGLAWVALWLTSHYRPEHSAWIAPFILASGAAFVWSLRGRTGDDLAAIVGIGGAAGCLLMLALVVRASGFSALDWAFLAMLCAGALVQVRLDDRYRPLAWIAAAAPLLLLFAAWRMQEPAIPEARFGGAALAFGLLFGGGANGLMWGARRRWEWAALSAAPAIGHLLMAYWALPAPPSYASWGGVALAVAVAYALAAVPVYRRSAADDEEHAAFCVLAAATTSLLTFSIGLELERRWIAAAWAFQVPILALLGAQLKVRRLHSIAACVAVLVVLHLLRPDVYGAPIRGWPLANTLLYTYGAPVAALFAAGRVMGRDGRASLSELVHALASLLAFMLVTLEVRHYFHPDDVRMAALPLAEAAALVVAWSALALLLHSAPRNWSARAAPIAGDVAATAAGVMLLLGVAWLCNPALRHESVGSLRILNGLLPCYGLPAAALVALGQCYDRLKRPAEALVAFGASLAVVFLLVTLEVRQWFHGEYLDAGLLTQAERYAYSAAWVTLGTALLALGIATRGLVLRWASLVVMLLAVGKVFLVDTAQLRDLYRVFSLLGLGVSLMLLAFLYQRFVFRRNGEAPLAAGGLGGA